MPNNCCVNSIVIASAAKQSRGHSTRPLDCFVARAPRNDGMAVFTFPKSTFLILGVSLVQPASPARRKKGNLDAMKACCCHLTDSHLLAGVPPASGLELVC